MLLVVRLFIFCYQYQVLVLFDLKMDIQMLSQLIAELFCSWRLSLETERELPLADPFCLAQGFIDILEMLDSGKRYDRCEGIIFEGQVFSYSQYLCDISLPQEAYARVQADYLSCKPAQARAATQVKHCMLRPYVQVFPYYPYLVLLLRAVQLDVAHCYLVIVIIGHPNRVFCIKI